MNKPRRLVVLSVAALGVAGGTAFAAAGGQSSPPGPPSVAQAQSVSAAQHDGYGVLRQAAAANLPAAVLDPPPEVVTEWGANPALARVTYPNGDRSDAWYVIPGNDSLCFYSVKLGQGGCGSMANAEAGKLLTWTVPTPATGKPDPSAGAEKVVGLVPDSVTGAKVTAKDGDAPAGVHGNVVEASGSGITGLKLDTASGGTLSVAGP